MSFFNKANIKKYSIMLIFFIVSLSFLAIISLIRKNSQKEMLQNAVSKVLEHYEDQQYSLVKEAVINRPIKSAIRLYELKNNERPSDVVFAALVRITGFCGPQSCVLIINPETEICTFTGIAGYSFPQHEHSMDYGISGAMIDYWKKNILTILQTEGII